MLSSMRNDLNIISKWVRQNSRILDLGCGDGTLLAHLQQHNNIAGYGLENDAEQIQRCIESGINVIEKTLGRHLDDFSDSSFDTVVMAFALQVMRYPDEILDEMLRIGNDCIVTFPNFGTLQSRLSLLFTGQMPVTKRLPYTWYNTPNIHFCTISDFEKLCKSKGYQIKNKALICHSPMNKLFKNVWPNLFAETAIYHLCK